LDEQEKELNKTIIESIDLDITTYEDYLKEISSVMLTNEVSKYPIFVLHQKETINLGRPIIDLNKSKTKWSVNVSHLEEFANKNIVKDKSLEAFKKVYKNPSDYICIFVLNNKAANFIFRPYTSKIKN